MGVALGRVAAKGSVPLEGITGLLAAPLALTVANAVQKGVAEAVNATGIPAGPTPLWVLAIKTAEYGCLGLALNRVGQRAWHSALGHLAVGLLVGVVFGGVFLTVVIQSSPVPLSTPALLAKGLNEHTDDLLGPLVAKPTGQADQQLAARSVTPQALVAWPPVSGRSCRRDPVLLQQHQRPPARPAGGAGHQRPAGRLQLHSLWPWAG